MDIENTVRLGAHMSIAGGVHLALERAADINMTACQIFTKNERQWVAKPLDPDKVKQFHDRREELAFNRTAIVSHASYLINLASPDEALWQKSMTAYKDELDRCQILDVPYLVVHPGAHVGSGLDAALRRVAEALNRMHDELPDNRTMTLLETTAGQGTCLGAVFEELATIADKVEDQERLGVCLDTCHVFAAGYDLRQPAGYDAMMTSLASTVGLARLKAIHLNDSKHALGSRKDRHHHIGEGEIGLEAFRSVLNDQRLRSVPALLETEKGDDGELDRKNMQTLLSLVKTGVTST